MRIRKKPEDYKHFGYVTLAAFGKLVGSKPFKSLLAKFFPHDRINLTSKNHGCLHMLKTDSRWKTYGLQNA